MGILAPPGVSIVEALTAPVSVSVRVCEFKNERRIKIMRMGR